MDVDPICPRCGQAEEDIVNAFLLCDEVRRIWFASTWEEESKLVKDLPLRAGINIFPAKEGPINRGLSPFKPNPKSWVRPREGVIKANFDASLKQNHGTGLGVVFRDHYGEVLSVGSVLLPNCYEAHIVEVITFRGVAKMTVNLSFGLIQFKSDFQRLVQTWKNKDSTGNNYLDNVIKETL
ncbi:hypothetical protein JHK82_053197 [Glycine max]|nr:hypothetical protein JHK82_053197 [Glycine max]